MKLLLLLILLTASFYQGISQEYPYNVNGEIEYSEVIEVQSNKDVLYSNAQEWIAKTFGDYKKVIQYEDFENKKLIMKGVLEVEHMESFSLIGIDFVTREEIHITLSIETKDNKYRYTISNILVYLLDENGIVQCEPYDLDDRFIRLKADINKIPHLERELQQLQNLNTSNYKKREILNHQKRISDLSVRINNYKHYKNTPDYLFLMDEIKQIKILIESLKHGMSKIVSDF